MEESHLTRVANSVRLCQVDLHPRRGHRGGGIGSRRIANQGRGDRGRSASSQHVVEQVGGRVGGHVDQTVDGELDGRRGIEQVGVANARVWGRPGVIGLREPNPQLLEITSLATSQAHTERSICCRHEGELNLLLAPALGERDREGMFGHIETTSDQISSILHGNL